MICWSTLPSWTLFVAAGLYITRKTLSGPFLRDLRSEGASHRLTVSPSCRFLRTRPAVCPVACSISVSHRSLLCRFLRTRRFLARGSWVSLYVEWLCWLSVLVYLWCGAAGSLSTGLLVVWGCWISLYWSTGGVGLLVLSTGLLVVWGCWISLYWTIGGEGLLVLSTGLLVVRGCWFSLLDYWW